MTQPISFVDLDDTLFQTHRRQAPDDTFLPASTDKEGKPLGYMSQTQQAFWAWLSRTTCVVPVTARDTAALARVALPFYAGAICCHGAVILDKDGNQDSDYHAHISQALVPLQTQMTAILTALFAHASDLGSVRGWTVGDELTYYVVVKQNSQAPLFLKELLARLDPALLTGFYWHMNGNNLAIIPNAVSKQKAVRYYVAKLEQKPLCFGVGDSLSDKGFLGECDFWATPKNSQLDMLCDRAIHDKFTQCGGFGY